MTLLDANQRPVGAWRMDARNPRFSVQMPLGEYGYEAHDDADRLVRSGTVRFGSTPMTIDLP